MRLRLVVTRAALVIVPLLLLAGLAEVALRVAGHSYQERFWRRVAADHERVRPVVTVLTRYHCRPEHGVPTHP